MAADRRVIESRRSRMIKAKKQRRSSMISMIICGLIVAVVLVFFVVGRQNLQAKNKEQLDKMAQLQQQIDDQLDRQKQLEEYAKYVQTKKYIEDIAKSKLGLIYPNEFIFKPVISE